MRRLAQATVAFAILAVLAGCAGDVAGDDSTAGGGDTLETIRSRGDGGLLIVGVEGNLPGFSDPSGDGAVAGVSRSGMDVDLALALAAAIFDGDADLARHVQFRPTTFQDRFDLLITFAELVISVASGELSAQEAVSQSQFAPLFAS